MTQSLMSLEDLFSHSWKRYRPRAGVLALFVLVQTLISVAIFVPTLLIVLVIDFVPIGHLFGLLNNFFKTSSPMQSITPTDIAILVCSIILLIVIMFFVARWMRAALWWLITDDHLTIGAALKNGWRTMPRMAGVSILGGLAILGGYILFIIPGILFSGWFLFDEQNVIAGNGPVRALGHSRALVRGRWWSVVFRTVIATAIIVVPLELAHVLGGIFSLRPENGVASALAALFLIAYFVLVFLIICVGMPWYFTFRQVLFEDVKQKTTSRDERATHGDAV